MRLEIDPGSRWPKDVVLEVEPLCPRPHDEAGWRRRILAQFPAGASTATITTCGYPMEIVVSDNILVALYAFPNHVAAVVARAPDGETLAARRAEIEVLLREARPDWSGPEVICLAQLWEG